jgi:hypothetical protein
MMVTRLWHDNSCCETALEDERLNRCKQCNAPLPINGTHCNRCNAPRDDIEEQDEQRRKRSPFVRFLCWIVGTFFSLTLLLWFAGCCVLGAVAGYLAYSLGLNEIFCWIIGIVVTLFTYGLSWMVLIFRR